MGGMRKSHTRARFKPHILDAHGARVELQMRDDRRGDLLAKQNTIEFDTFSKHRTGRP